MDVTSKIESDQNNEPIIHSAKFIYNTSGNLIADREYNTQSYALSTKSGGFLSVKNDPKSPNRQFAKLTEDRYLETKIIGRLQEKIDNNIFITDELILQILHTPELSRVSQVETITEFKNFVSPRVSELVVNIEKSWVGFEVQATDETS